VPWLHTMEVWRGFGRTRDDGLALLAGRTAETARPEDAAAYPCTWTALMGWLDSSVCWPFSTCTSQ
jgi:hypothetical protein